MDWEARLRAQAIISRASDHDLAYLPTILPAVPREYETDGLVALTFRWRARREGGHLYAMILDLAAAIRLGERWDLTPAQAIALVDSHERTHIAVQLAGISEEDEEEAVRVVDAAWFEAQGLRPHHA